MRQVRKARPRAKRVKRIAADGTVWDNTARRSSARFIRDLILRYSPNSVASAYTVAGMFIECVDASYRASNP